MTHSPNPGQEPEPTEQQRRQRRRPGVVWRRAALGLGIATVVGGTAGVLWLFNFIYEDLVPIIDRSLTETLNRPVRVGGVEGFTLSGITLGSSEIPATDTDADRVIVEKVIARFDPLELLFTRRLGLDVTLVRPQGFLDEGPDGRWVETQIKDGGEQGFIKTELETLRVQDGTLVLIPSPERKAIALKRENERLPAIQVPLSDLQAIATFHDNNQRIEFEADAAPNGGGVLHVEGETIPKVGNTGLAIRAEKVAAKFLTDLAAIPITAERGLLFANMGLQFRNNQLEALSGTARIQQATARLAGVPTPLTAVSTQVRFQGKQITLENAQGIYGSVPATAQGTIHLEDGFNLTAQLRAVTITSLQKTFQFKLPIAITGAFNTDARITGPLDNPLVTAIIGNSRSVRVDRLDFEDLRANVRFQNQTLTFDEIAATPTVGGVIEGSGQLNVAEGGRVAISAQARGLPGDAIARLYGLNLASTRVGGAPVRLGNLAATVAVAGPLNGVETEVRWRAPEATYPAQGTVAIAGERLRLRNAVAQVAGGTVNAEGEIVRGRWQVSLRTAGIALRQFSNQLSGLLDGTLQASGSLNDTRLSSIRAAGRANLSNAPVLNRAVATTFRWTGDRLVVERSSGRGFLARGFVVPRLEGRGAPTIANMNLNVAVDDVNLASLPVTLPSQVQVRGRAGFNGRVTGNLNTPQVAGRLRVNDLAVNALAFERSLSGPVQFTGGRGVDLNLTGGRDQVAVRLDSRYRPISFRVQQGNAIAEGYRTGGDRLLASLQNFPLTALNLNPATQLGLGTVSGQLSGNLDVNVNTFATQGRVAIARPGIGYIQPDGCLTTDFRYGNNQVLLPNAELRIISRAQRPRTTESLCTGLFDGTLEATSRYRLIGTATLSNNPRFEGKVIADRGNLQDILTTFEWFELSDFARGVRPGTYGNSANLTTIPVGDPNARLIDQLRRYSEILVLIGREAEQRAENERLPSLREVQGEFAGEVNIRASQRAGLSADFDLSGQDWRWGDYRAETFTAQGEFNNGVLTLLPLQLVNGDALLSFTGTVGGEQQSGQLEARNVPIAPLRNLLRLPIELDGKINAIATLEGSIANPQARGAITLNNATLNQTPVQAASGSFSYVDARLRFISRISTTEGQPLQVTGDIPYAFDFMRVRPSSDVISLDLNVQDEGLSFLNALTDQVEWQGGRGAVDVKVSGTLRAPQILGNIRLEQASLAAQALPEPLTNVDATIQFNGEQIDVEQFSGQFQQGRVTAQGILPILAASSQGNLPETSEGPIPLTIGLEQVVLNFRGLYRGGVDGSLQITGAALAPRIGGQLTLSNGRVELPSGTQTASATASNVDTESIVSPPQLNNLQLTLGRRLQVTLLPILNFVATGDLIVNGPLGALRPAGIVELQSGQVNLFTTQFNLAPRSENFAEFRPERGLDPILNVSLATTVPEVTRFPTENAALFPADEIVEPLATDFGILDTVRIRAEVSGPASRVFDNLSLTSTPPRSQDEIVALLGGGFVATLGRGDSTLAIANLASSALLTSVQNLISNALGLTDFRLYPTNISSEQGSTTLGLAAELGVDLSSDLSASVLQILTASSPTQFNLRYRLNEEFTLRGFVDTEGSSGFLVEFETRF